MFNTAAKLNLTSFWMIPLNQLIGDNYGTEKGIRDLLWNMTGFAKITLL